MKRLIFLCLIGIYFSRILYAELPKIGVVAGMNFAKYSTSVISPRVGFHVGGKAEFGLSKLLGGLYCEVGELFSLKGGKEPLVTLIILHTEINLVLQVFQAVSVTPMGHIIILAHQVSIKLRQKVILFTAGIGQLTLKALK